MNFIEIPIYCHTEKSNELADLGIRIEDEYEVKSACINPEKVQAFYVSNAERVETILHIDGDTFSVALTYEKVKELLCK